MIFSVKSVKIRIIRGKITRLAVFYFPFQGYWRAPLSAAATTPGTFGAWAAAQGITPPISPPSSLRRLLR
jgi:hypothetical protein